METVVNYEGKMLIKKYNQYYIRFTGGAHEELLCDLSISNKDAMEIITDNSKISKVFLEYKKKTEWTREHFIDSAIKDHMFYACHMSEKRIEKGIEKLNRHEDIKWNFMKR